jgi:hypothetical protein
VSDPSLALQGALVTLLKDAGGIGVGARVYDTVPNNVTFPYVTVGDDQIVGDDDDCEELSQAFCTIHVWSRAMGWPEAKGIAGNIRARLRSPSLSISGFAVDDVKFDQSQYLEDPDGITRHVVIDYRFLITHP